MKSGARNEELREDKKKKKGVTGNTLELHSHHASL